MEVPQLHAFKSAMKGRKVKQAVTSSITAAINATKPLLESGHAKGIQDYLHGTRLEENRQSWNYIVILR